jgi:acetyl esterase/lipase
MGTSAGGHLAALAAMKPHDPRYATLPLEGGDGLDATSACILVMWPVICPATRWKDNEERRNSGADQYAHRVGGGTEQMKYWLTEEAMADGSPMLALERGDKVSKPPLLYVQATGDNLHPKPSMDRFCENYNKLGGTAEALMIEGEPYDFLRSQPESAEAKRAIKRMTDFIHENTDKR